MKNQPAYRQCSLMCFSESWLNDSIADTSVDIAGFTAVRVDRDPRMSGKTKGGGLTLYVNNRWCHPGLITVKERICCRDDELLVVGLRPYYIPREFTHIIAIVYVPPRAVPADACDVIHETVARDLTRHPGAFLVISGDFNHVSLSSHLTVFIQYVDCPHHNKTLDLLYANAKEAYTATALPPLCKSDHNLVFLLPSYRPCVVRQPLTTRSFRKWTPEARETLRVCYECTDWTVLENTEGNRGCTVVDRRVDCCTDYVTWCRHCSREDCALFS